MPKSVAQINKETGIVENFIIINEGDTMETHYLVEVPKPYTLMDDSFYVLTDVQIGETKWSEEKGFTDLEGKPVLKYLPAR